MPSHVGTIVGGFLPEEKTVTEDLGGQPHEASWILTFPLSKASPGACRSYLTRRVLYTLCLQMYCTLTYRI
jgi:hypothetical protein